MWCILKPTKKSTMARQSISLTKPNDEWLKSQVDSQEYSSKSELVNDLIRQARNQQNQVDWLRKKLEIAEQSGFTKLNNEEIRSLSKNKHWVLRKLFVKLSKKYFYRALVIPKFGIFDKTQKSWLKTHQYY
jgi:antitoxin ParD1/3/4